MDKLKLLPKLAEVGSFFPKLIAAKDAACKQVIHRTVEDGGQGIDLRKLPVLTTWPEDGGPFITLPCVVTRDPKSGKRNVGMYRMQVYDGADHRHALAAAEERRGASARPAAAPRTGSRSRFETWRARVEMMAQTAGGTTAAANDCGDSGDDADQDSRRADGGRGGDRHRSGDDVLGDCARAAGGRGVSDRGVPARQAGGAGASARRWTWRFPRTRSTCWRAM